MVDKTKDGPPPVSPANGEGPARPRREPPTIDLTPAEVVEESAPLGSHRHAGSPPAGQPAPKPETAKPETAKPEPVAGKPSAPASVPGVAAKAAAASPATPSAAPAAGKPAAGTAASAEKPSTAKPAAEKPSETAPGKAGAAPAAGAPPKDSTQGASKDEAAAKAASAPASETVPKVTRAAPPVPPARGGAGTALLAGLLGGLVGAAATAAAGWFLLQPAWNPTEQLAAVEDNVERRVEQALSVTARRADLDALAQRVTGLDGELRAGGERLGALADRVDGLAQAAPAPQPAEPAADPQALAALGARVDQLAALGARVDQLAGLQATVDRLTGLEATVGQLGNLQASVAELTGLPNRVDSLETAIKAVDPGAGREAREAAAKAEALSGRLSALEGAPSDPRIGLLSRALVASRLAAAIDAGRPYAAELAALKQAAGAGADLASLDPDAATGLPTRAALAREFSTLTDRLVVEAPPADGGFIDRLAASASRVVRIRPVDGEATGALGTVGQIETALARGDLKAALEAWRTLPEPARRLSQAWAGRLEARVAADAKVEAVLSEAVAALADRPQGARNP